MQWVEKKNVTYVFKEGGMIIDRENPVEGRSVRGRCIAYARRLNDGTWEVKRTGKGHAPFPAIDQVEAHGILKEIAFGR